MSNGNTRSEDWLIKLQDALTDLKVTTTSVESKLDQLKEGFESIQNAINALNTQSNSQETRITLLEATCKTIPSTMNEDLALIKAQLSTYQKFLWLVAAAVVGLFARLIFPELM
jgi:chromosome segregation ATPase